ncbi:MAG: acyl-CoA/acyl-ACP dehydrogenase [Solirubrobacteraceae bacterium]|nr:acyl-CoA/acyl-ACP dehydrogenase [Solirubrobacteraceae bacterium]
MTAPATPSRDLAGVTDARRLTEDQQTIADTLADFCQGEAGTREQRERLTDGGTTFHHEPVYRKLAELGYVGACLPEQYGGGGGDIVDLCVFLEETAYGRLPIAATGVTMIVAGAVERFGTEEQKQHYLGRIAAGDAFAIAMSEPGSGSDVASMRTKALVEGEQIVVNGHKTWITCAREADEILLIARSEQTERKHDGLSMVFIPRDTHGLDIRPIETMGGNEQCDVFFTDVTVPTSKVLGTVGGGWGQLVAGLNVERLIIGAIMLGIARRAFDDSLAYVREREQFGKKIGSFQAMKHRVSDLATELRCAELLVYDVARSIAADPHRLLPREASMAKLKVSEVAKRIALEGVQMMGGYGYASEYDMEFYLRQTIASTIYGGTNEIQRDIIGMTYGL